jgi:hypothetical protein
MGNFLKVCFISELEAQKEEGIVPYQVVGIAAS